MKHEKNWEFLKGKLEGGCLGHAYLLSGSDGIGKKAFAKEFIKLIHCLKNVQGPTSHILRNACGLCQNCRLVESETFPDLLVVASNNSDSSLKNERDMMEIDIGQIRQVNTFLSYKSYYGGYKTVIIDSAERMNQEAQNSFLKTLEEPKGKTIIFLITSKPEILLPTIFSRCQAFTFLSPIKYEIPKKDQQMLQELLRIMPLELAEKFQYTKKINLEGDNFNKILEVLQRHFRNTLLHKLGVVKGGNVEGYSVLKLKKILTLIEALHRKALTSNVNTKLALEILLLEI